MDIGGYKDKATFDGGYNPVEVKSLRLTKTEFQALTTPGVVAGTKGFVNMMESVAKESMQEFLDSPEATIDTEDSL